MSNEHQHGFDSSEFPVDWGGQNYSHISEDDVLRYIIDCHHDASHALRFTGDINDQAVEIAPAVVEKMKALGGGLSDDIRNAVREALNHLLMTHPLVGKYFDT